METEKKERVVSKNLFNYQLNGVLSDEVKQLEQSMKEKSNNPEMNALKDLVDSSPDDNCEAVVKFIRLAMQGIADLDVILFKESIDQCTHTEFTVKDGNEFEVPVLVHTPTQLVNKKGNAAIIYAHGGGAISAAAYMFKGILSKMAVEGDLVYFNVDYRLAPETKCPENARDFYRAIKYIIKKADEFGIDASTIAIAGDSGGGYICFASMIMLAQNDESNLVKLAITGVPMISDYCFTDPASMTKEEREAAPMMRKIWHCIANDFECDKNNPLLFPAKVSDEILQKMPPTIIWENEFDIYITEASRMACRMRRAGRLLEFRVQPGMNHSSTYFPGTEGHNVRVSDFKRVVKEYLLG